MDIARFNKYYVKQEDGCWLWTGGRTGKGYGKCGHAYRTIDAHVMSHRLFKGPVPQGQVVRHTCHVKLCVNPKHLLVGTHTDNMQDLRDSGRPMGRKPKVLDAEVLQIYKHFHAGATKQQIAAQFKLPVNYIHQLLTGHFRKPLFAKFVAENGPLRHPHTNTQPYQLLQRRGDI